MTERFPLCILGNDPENRAAALIRQLEKSECKKLIVVTVFRKQIPYWSGKTEFSTACIFFSFVRKPEELEKDIRNEIPEPTSGTIILFELSTVDKPAVKELITRLRVDKLPFIVSSSDWNQDVLELRTLQIARTRTISSLKMYHHLLTSYGHPSEENEFKQKVKNLGLSEVNEWNIDEAKMTTPKSSPLSGHTFRCLVSFQKNVDKDKVTNTLVEKLKLRTEHFTENLFRYEMLPSSHHECFIKVSTHSDLQTCIVEMLRDFFQKLKMENLIFSVAFLW